jgi:hypothetical protein
MESSELDNLIKKKNIYLFCLLKNIQGVEYYPEEQYNGNIISIRVYADEVRDNEWKYLKKKDYLPLEYHYSIGYCHYKKKICFDIYL